MTINSRPLYKGEPLSITASDFSAEEWKTMAIRKWFQEFPALSLIEMKRRLPTMRTLIEVSILLHEREARRA